MKGRKSLSFNCLHFNGPIPNQHRRLPFHFKLMNGMTQIVDKGHLYPIFPYGDHRESLVGRAKMGIGSFHRFPT